MLMIIGHENDLSGVNLAGEDLRNVSKKVLISPEQGWNEHVMRLFELAEGGYTPRHKHAWPHINYVVRGKGLLFLDGREYELKGGSYAYVPAGKEHQFLNRGNESFTLICIVPVEGEQ